MVKNNLLNTFTSPVGAKHSIRECCTTEIMTSKQNRIEIWYSFRAFLFLFNGTIDIVTQMNSIVQALLPFGPCRFLNREGEPWDWLYPMLFLVTRVLRKRNTFALALVSCLTPTGIYSRCSQRTAFTLFLCISHIVSDAFFYS